ncbi:hypothetical protein ACWPKO_11910 [Coraliomargarita sp. W4R53]
MKYIEMLKKGLLETAVICCESQRSDGAFDPGRNGPWGDEDTPARVTAHYAILLNGAWQFSDQTGFLDASKKACNWLCDNIEDNPLVGIACRKSSEKSSCNGLIGQAWVAEALVSLGVSQQNERYLRCARALLHNPIYDWKIHGWRPVESNGDVLDLIATVNQQIWFAAIRSELQQADSNSVDEELDDFMSNLSFWVKRSPNGLPRHEVPILSVFNRLKRKLRGMLLPAPGDSAGDGVCRLELGVGYASFLLYGLAILISNREIDARNQSSIRDLIISFMNQIELELPPICGTSRSYAWSYNPTGIEMAYLLQIFDSKLKHLSGEAFKAQISAEGWIEMQLTNYTDEAGVMCKNTVDPVTLMSRLYECVRILN